MGTQRGMAPILGGGRKGLARLFLDLCSEQSSFRVCLEFAVTGAIVLTFLHGLQPFWRSDSSSHSGNSSPVAGISLPPLKRADDGWTLLKDAPPALKLTLNSQVVEGSVQRSYRHRDGHLNHWAFYGTFASAKPNSAFFVSQDQKTPPIQRKVADNLERFSPLKSVQHTFSQDYYELATRFGDLRAVKFETVADGIRKTCVGFHKPESGYIFIAGYVCSQDENEVSPEKAACLLDHLGFVNSVDENMARTALATEAKSCRSAPRN
jgi:hypothetical protein